jgi:hypothetical protein
MVMINLFKKITSCVHGREFLFLDVGR